MNRQTNGFKELDGGTLFTGQQYWQFTEDTTGKKQMGSSIGIWPWEAVLSVQTINEVALPELEHPRCAVELASCFLYFNEEFETVAAAWRRWRLRYGRQTLTFTTPS